MNRQLKRANEKSDKRREREQQRRKELRRESRVRVTQTKRSASKTAQTKEGKAAEGKAAGSSQNERPAPGMGRSIFNTAYLVFTVSVITSQAFVPQQTNTLALVTHVFIYLILGYFFVLWLYRRGVTQALTITLLAGFGLALGVEGLKALLPQLGFPQLPPIEGATAAPNVLYVALAVPGLLVGTWLGRYIYKRS